MGDNGKTVLPAASVPARKRFFLLSGLQAKLIFPYVFLTLILASIGIFIITRLVVDSDRERISNSVLNDSKIANDSIVQNERAQLEKLRYLIFTAGMAQAIYDRNADQVQALLKPNFTTASSIDVMTAIDLDGKEILTFARELDNKEVLHEQRGGDFSNLPSVQKILSGVQDDQGDKFIDILQVEQGAILITSAPVRDSTNKTVGVMMVGTYFKNVLKEIRGRTFSEVVMVDLNSNLIASTLSGNEEGFQQLLALIPASFEEKTTIQEITLDQRPYLVAFSGLIIRQQQVGWISVVRDSEYMVTQTGRSRELFILLFTAGTLAVILIGYFLARSLAKPLIKLRNLTQAVAAGDLSQSIHLQRSDEIGELGDAFDTMTIHLRERTEEAERLYTESLQRNRELAEINARLESTQLQLIQSEKLASIGHLTAGIVHDVKNPFAVIMGMAEVLADDENLDETMKHGLKTIRESAIKGNTIVSDLLKFARQSQPEMRTLDLRETVRTSQRMTAYLTRRFNLVTEIPDNPVMVTYDAQQIEQVLINIIHNAVQAMPNKGTLRVALECVDTIVKIHIADTGYGIPAENLKRIFDPFFTTKPEGEGTGLGLSVSYGIIANHHGRIDVTSEVGKGTTFTIVLPTFQPTSILKG